VGSAKGIILRPIPQKDAVELVKRVHYSGKVVQNSTIHIGVFYNGKLEGAMQFGSSLDKRKIQPLVSGTLWNEFIELNRMAFSDVLPRNSESRALSIAFKLLRKHAPHIKWIISFADGTQCGDGTIYRAAGFVLTAIKENGNLYRLPRAGELDPAPLLAVGLGENDVNDIRVWLHEITPLHAEFVGDHKLSVEDRPAHKMSLEGAPHAHKMSLEGGARPSQSLSKVKEIMRRVTNGGTSADKLFSLMGGYPAEGFQFRYIYFLDPAYRTRLTVPEVPYSRIAEMGASMYKGEKR